jgi:hypothetical protein
MQTKDRGQGKPAGLSPGTIKTRFNNVRSVLRAAVRDRLIVADPSDGVTLPRGAAGGIGADLAEHRADPLLAQ